MGCTQSVPVEMGAPVNSSKLPSVEKTVVSGKPPSIPVRSARALIPDGLSSTSATQRETTTSDSDANNIKGGGGGGGAAARGRFASYASGASTPDEYRSEDESVGSSGSGTSDGGGTRRNSGLRRSDKKLVHSTSAIGLDKMIDDRRDGGDLRQNVVHIEVPFGKPIEEVYEGVHNGPVLGSGISGLVRLVTHRSTGIKYAVKVLDLGLVDNEEGLKQLREEIFIMCQLDHPNIVRLEEVYESHSEIYLVQELCLGGELFDRLDEQPDYHYTEAECARLIKQMLSAVRYLHTKGIIHRDLKLENFLFSSTDPNSELKMIDFGLSKHFRYGEVHHEAVGTPYTVSPEVIRGSYDERCDVWAIGVITFLLLSGEPPFGGCGGPEPLLQVRSNILKGAFRFEPMEVWTNVSSSARDFIKALLVTDPKRRPTARAAQKHMWLQEWANRSRQDNDNVLNPNVVKALVNFKEFSDMRKLLCEVLSFTLLPEQIKDLRSEFEKMDTDGSGEISLAALKQVLMTNAGAGSLGALTEEEVEDIFNAMRVRKTDTRIRWHEFIAAGLSQCQVDDRNLRLAFERLDSDHKGYITLDDIMDLMGSNTMHSEEAFQRMWGDSIKAVKCQQHARITYGDFLLLMKGQTKDTPSQELERELNTSATTLQAVNSRANVLGVVHEAPTEGEERMVSPEQVFNLPSGDQVTSDGRIRDAPPTLLSLPLENITEGVPLETVTDGELVALSFRSSGTLPSGTQSAPTTPTGQRHMVKLEDDMDSPVAMDTGYAVNGQSLTPPQSPERGVHDYVTPSAENRFTVSLPSNVEGIMVPGLPIARPDPYTRRRSKSLGGDDAVKDNSNSNMSAETKDADLHTLADAVLDMIVPEAHHHATAVPSSLDVVVKDETKTPLVVNRQLYRAHRQLRLSVLEASKRFEEQQAAHARDILIAQHEAEGKTNDSNNKVIHAGLVMRHGEKKHISSEAIRSLLRENQRQQQALVEKFSKRGGRGKRIRKKTVSDMAGMLSSMGQDDMGSLATRAMASEELTEPPALQASVTASDIPMSHLQPSDEVEGQIRHATVPGEFRKTYDPFSREGKYGAVAAWDSAYPTPH